jgi:hypothetical protein
VRRFTIAERKAALIVMSIVAGTPLLCASATLQRRPYDLVRPSYALPPPSAYRSSRCDEYLTQRRVFVDALTPCSHGIMGAMKSTHTLHVLATSGFLIALCGCGTQTALLAPNQQTSGSIQFPQSSGAPVIGSSGSSVTAWHDGDLPGGGWQYPYDPNPFTTAICASDPCSPTLDPNSASMVSEVMSYVGGFNLGEVQEAEPDTNGQGQADTFPVYFASQNDPSYSVTCDKFGGCAGFMPSVVHIPNGAHASIDSDHHVTVIELWADLEIDFWQFNDGGTGHGTTTPVSGGGSLSAAFAGVCQAKSLAERGRCPGAGVAAAVPVQPGIIDPREWIHGQIKHTIYVAVPCPAPNFLWPAAASDGQCSSGPLDGERIWLNLTHKQISALPMHHWAKVLLHAMHRYGLMVVDTSGPGSPWNFYGIDNATMTLWGKPAPWTSFFAMVASEGDGAALDYGDNASHLAIPTTGITQSNIQIVK